LARLIIEFLAFLLAVNGRLLKKASTVKLREIAMGETLNLVEEQTCSVENNECFGVLPKHDHFDSF